MLRLIALICFNTRTNVPGGRPVSSRPISGCPMQQRRVSSLS